MTASVRSESGHAALQDALAPLGDKGQILIFDTRDEAQIRAAAAEVSEPVDALIANAGAYGPQRQSALYMDFDGVLDLININTLGPLRVVQAFLPLLRQGERPRIALMSSVLGSMALEEHSPWATASRNWASTRSPNAWLTISSRKGLRLFPCIQGGCEPIWADPRRRSL